MIPYEEIVKNTSYYIKILRDGTTFNDQTGIVEKNKFIIRNLSYQYRLALMRPYALIRTLSMYIRGFDGIELDKVDVDAIRYEVLSLI